MTEFEIGMQIIINGEARQIDEHSSVQSVLEQMQLQGKRIAVEVNREIIPRARHAEYQLAEGDSVEIIHAVGGG